MKHPYLQVLFSIGFIFLFNQLCWSDPIIVTNTSDSGSGSLRTAIETANSQPGADEIHFNIPGAGPHEITLLTQLPSLIESVQISGYSQPGSTMATGTTAASLKIAINGSNVVGQDIFGLTLGNNCAVSGVAIYNFPVAFNVGGNNNWIYGCHIGMDATGMVAMGNEFDGILITGTGNVIGGTNASDRNIIAANGTGIAVFPYAINNTIQGNYIGTDATGNTTVSNTWDGIGVGSSNNIVSNNVVVGHQNSNIAIGWWMDESPYPNGNVVSNNRVGHHADGTFSDYAFNCQGISIVYASNTLVTENIVFGNGCHGVSVVGDVSTGNLISNNSIYGNANIAINLGSDWITPNDPGDLDIGANNLQNYPVLEDARVNDAKIKIKGSIDTQDPENVLIEFYSITIPHTSGYGGGETFIGSTYPAPNGKIKADLPALTTGTYITAIAIDDQNNTSEFSAAIEVDNPSNDALVVTNSGSALAYPNPFSEETTILFRVPERQRVNLVIIDFQGRQVQTLVNDRLEIGNYGYQLDSRNLPDGIYYYQLATEDYVQTGKLIKQGTGW